MNVTIFLGPTLPRAEAEVILEARYLPPVAQGDLYREARRRPRAIGIVDGYFDRVPSVWHKEILWALSQGIYVFGAASMGALRASELAEFGVIGVGHVFKAFHDGTLEDDDEVAVLHGGADDGYRSISDAMVDIRATLEAASDAGVIGSDDANELIRLAKGCPYGERSFKRLLRDGSARAIPGLAGLGDWLPENRIFRKRRDAVMLLRVMKEFMCSEREPFVASFKFEHTDAWEAAKDYVRPEPGDEAAIPNLRIADELRLRGEWEATRAGALARALILQGPAARLLPQIDPLRAEHDFRYSRGLIDSSSFGAWCTRQGMTLEQLRIFFVEEAAVQIIALAWREDVMRELPNYLRANGKLEALACPEDEPGQREGGRVYLEDLMIDESTLFDWYFREYREMPRVSNLEQFAVTAGFEDLAEFRRAVVTEYRHRTNVPGQRVANGDDLGRRAE